MVSEDGRRFRLDLRGDTWQCLAQMIRERRVFATENLRAVSTPPDQVQFYRGQLALVDDLESAMAALSAQQVHEDQAFQGRQGGGGGVDL